jgi:acyl-CoA synthetase (AMP-forming)/AMP-acid ligase II
MPLHHTNGINNQLVAPFIAGASVVLAAKFRAEEIEAQIDEYGVTYMTGVPTMYSRIIPHLRDRARLNSLRMLRCGSAPITVALHEQIEAAFGVPLVVSYGLSEATCTSTMNPPGARRLGSVGTVLPGQQVRLFRPGTAQEAPAGSEGEIRISGPCLMAGYIGADVEQPIQDGWLGTGDLGRFDDDGYLAITGRIKDVIIRGGENLSPQLIEGVLVQHPRSDPAAWWADRTRPR